MEDIIPTRQEQIHDKGFSFHEQGLDTYSKMKVGGVRTLDDALLDLGALKQANKQYGDKQTVLRALADRDIETQRAISNYFYNTNGIYTRACNYFATLYRYDWYVVPEIFDTKVKDNKIITEFNNILHYLDNSNLKEMSGDIAAKVIVDGAYYGYKVDLNDRLMIQELPIKYCRSRYLTRGKPAIEFNMKFFDDAFTDIGYRMRVLKLFPEEFQKGYVLYKQNKLLPDFQGQAASWYLLDPDCAFKFSVSPTDAPLFINAIPALLDLDAAQDLDRRKQMQKLLKIIVQKLPLDKNGDLIFDVDEARDIHNNAVVMLSRAIGVDVLTTFTDVDSIDMSDRATSTAVDDLEKNERTVYNSLGISQNLFNTDGNLSLEKSVLNDEAQFRKLVLQLGTFFDEIVMAKSKDKKKFLFRLYMLETTQYNYQTLSKMYKDQVQLGYSKMLPQIAMGHSQNAIINTAYFENKVLKLHEVMIPPLMSSTMNSETILGGTGKSGSGNSQNISEGNKGGRPEKPDDQKSEKTIQNRESMN